MSIVFRVLLLLGAFSLLPSHVFAFPQSVDVFYNHTGAPPGTQAASASEMERVVQGVLREWEQHSFSSFNPIYRGTTVATDFCTYGHDVILVQWHPMGASAPCASYMWEKPVVTAWSWCINTVHRITLNSDVVFETRGSGSVSCANVRHRLTHEFAHMLRMTFLHPDNSVLMVNSPLTALVRSHVWNSDIEGVVEWNPIFSWPRAGGSLSLERYDMFTSNSVSAGGTTFSDGFNHTAALSAGGSAFAYSRVFTDHAFGVFFEQGDGSGSNWQAQRFFADSTYHRACLATSTDGAHLLAAWAGIEETQLAGTLDTNPEAGTRPIRFVESHDGGSTWTTPALFSGLRVRSGVACSYDAFQNRFMLLASDNLQNVRIAHRLPTASAPWSAATELKDQAGSPVRSVETPLVSFDTFSFGQEGHIAWYDTDSNDNHMMQIEFRWCTQIPGGCTPQEQPGKYVSDSGRLSPWVDSFEPNILRSAVVPNSIEGIRHWAHSMQLGTVGVNRRRGFDFNQNLLNVFSDYTAVSGNAWALTRYHTSGPNRFFFETAYLVYNNNG
jgi:hypothetical protein